VVVVPIIDDSGYFSVSFSTPWLFVEDADFLTFGDCILFVNDSFSFIDLDFKHI
jgi:hypothetical protein